MCHLTRALCTSFAVVAVIAGGASPAAASPRKAPEARILERALKLLPEPPMAPIRLIDPDLAPDPDAIRRLDAFLVHDRDGGLRQVIYLNLRSAIVENALRGKDVDLAILAAVIRHEQEHLRGAAEPQARRAEREFFQQLVFAGRVPVNEGLAYLADLEQNRQISERR